MTDTKTVTFPEKYAIKSITHILDSMAWNLNYRDEAIQSIRNCPCDPQW